MKSQIPGHRKRIRWQWDWDGSDWFVAGVCWFFFWFIASLPISFILYPVQGDGGIGLWVYVAFGIAALPLIPLLAYGLGCTAIWLYNHPPIRITNEPQPDLRLAHKQHD